MFILILLAVAFSHLYTLIQKETRKNACLVCLWKKPVKGQTDQYKGGPINPLQRRFQTPFMSEKCGYKGTTALRNLPPSAPLITPHRQMCEFQSAALIHNALKYCAYAQMHICTRWDFLAQLPWQQWVFSIQVIYGHFFLWTVGPCKKKTFYTLILVYICQPLSECNKITPKHWHSHLKEVLWSQWRRRRLTPPKLHLYSSQILGKCVELKGNKFNSLS